ncbi:MAG: DUF72 domain-containing protein [Rhizobacter sp.]
MTVSIGISGWRYEPWRGVYYLKGLPQHQELAFAARMFPSVEINGSFYSLQPPESWATWRDATPPGFVFSVKGPRYITHILRLKGIEAALANFFASGLLDLRDKLGPLLWQFPPTMRFDPARFEAFFRLLPADTRAAGHLAAQHDARVGGRTALGDGRQRPLRHAIEVRHDSFVDPDFIALLRRHRIGLVVADTAGRWPDREDLTADFVYVRLHGAETLYASGYTDAGLDRWAERIRAWESGGQVPDARLTVPGDPPHHVPRDVYCYFDNDIKVHAPFDAVHLSERLGQPSALGPDGRFSLESSPLHRPTPSR